MTGRILSLPEVLKRLQKTIQENGDTPSRSEILYAAHLLEKKKQAARIPEKYRNETFESFNVPIEDSRNIALLKQWVKTIATVKTYPHFAACCITGKNGSGKTHLGISLLERMSYDGMYLESEELVVRILRARSYKSAISEEGLLKSLVDSSLIVLDEIGRGQNAEVEQHIIFKLVNMRYKCNKPIVLISNKAREDFQDFIGKAVVDRISERCVFICLNADSYRRKIARGEVKSNKITPVVNQ